MVTVSTPLLPMVQRSYVIVKMRAAEPTSNCGQMEARVAQMEQLLLLFLLLGEVLLFVAAASALLVDASMKNPHVC